MYVNKQKFLISEQVRINCLLCLGKLLEYMDKWTVLDDILPLLPQIPTREPAVLMSMLGKADGRHKGLHFDKYVCHYSDTYGSPLRKYMKYILTATAKYVIIYNTYFI